MEEVTDKGLSDLRSYAKSIGMTPEEYALSLHENNQAMKSVLLENGADFKSFVTEFHEVLDGLAEYKESDAKKSTNEHYELIKRVTDLLLTTSHNPKLLAQLYQHFPGGIEGKMEELNQSIN